MVGWQWTYFRDEMRPEGFFRFCFFLILFLSDLFSVFFLFSYYLRDGHESHG